MVCQGMIQILPQVTIRSYLMKREYHRCCQQMVIFLLLQSWRRHAVLMDPNVSVWDVLAIM